MSPDKLVCITNQISTFFRSKLQAKVITGVAEYINKFWDRRMGEQQFAIIDEGRLQSEI